MEPYNATQQRTEQTHHSTWTPQQSELNKLCTLAQLDGESGNEQQVRDHLAAYARPFCDRLEIDSMGNLIAVKGADKPGPRVMVCAHMDESAMMVAGIHETGLLHCKPVGNIDEHTLLGTHVLVGPQHLPGVIGGKPVHLLHGDERRKMPGLDDLFVDIGADNKQSAEKLVAIGDYVTFATTCASFGTEMVKGKALASRCGCAVLLRLMALALPYPFYAAFTVQKEIGLRGARIAAYRVNPQIAIAIGCAPASDMPEVPNRQILLGSGPALGCQEQWGIPDVALTRWLGNLAATRKIPIQWLAGKTTNSEAGALQQAHEGVRVATVAVPCRYPNTPVNVVSLQDIDNATLLVTEALSQLAKGDCLP